MGRHDQDDWGIAEEAARWVYRLKGPAAKFHYAAFQRWLMLSRAHRREFYLASMTDMQMNALKCYGSTLRYQLDDPTREASLFRCRFASIGRSSSKARATWIGTVVLGLLFPRGETTDRIVPRAARFNRWKEKR